MAKIVAFRPIELVETGNWRIERRDQEDKFKWHVISNGPEMDFLGPYMARLLDASPYRSGLHDEARPGSFGYEIHGTPNSIPDKFISIPNIRVNNAPFLTKMRQGVMVVSNYQRGQVHLRYTNGGNPIKGVTSLRVKNFSLICKNWYGLYYDSSGIYRDENRDYRAIGLGPAVKVNYQKQEWTDELTPYAVGWEDSIATGVIHDAIRGSARNSASLWTSLMSDANRATVDILTAMGETPETVNSLKTLFTGILNGFRAAKNKELRIIDRTKKVRYESEMQLRRMDFEFKKDFYEAKSKRRQRMIQKKFEADVKRVKNDLAKTLEELASAIAQVWLTFRYAIMTNVYLIRDIAEALESYKRRYVTFRNTSLVDYEVDGSTLPEGWKASGKIHVYLRGFVRRKFERVSQLASMLKELSANLLTTAWELVRLSFVVDWFVNIGDFISAMFGEPANSQYTQVATESVKCDTSTIIFNHEKSGCQVVAEYSFYSRKVEHDPERHCGLVYDPLLTTERKLDAAALAWVLFGQKMSAKFLRLK